MSDVCLTYKPVKTRKPHRCFGCFQEFPAGTTMQLNSGIFDGHFYTSRTCETCQKLSTFVEEHYRYDGWPEGWAAEELSESGLNPGYRGHGPRVTVDYLLEYFRSQSKQQA